MKTLFTLTFLFLGLNLFAQLDTLIINGNKFPCKVIKKDANYVYAELPDGQIRQFSNKVIEKVIYFGVPVKEKTPGYYIKTAVSLRNLGYVGMAVIAGIGAASGVTELIVVGGVVFSAFYIASEVHLYQAGTAIDVKFQETHP